MDFTQLDLKSSASSLRQVGLGQRRWFRIKSEGCDSLCPASEMGVFYGRSIDSAYSRAGKPCSALANARRYRTELVDGCTCNGKDKVGLAKIKIEDDETLRRGDIVVTADGLQVIRKAVRGEPHFAEASTSVQAQFARPARVSSVRIE